MTATFAYVLSGRRAAAGRAAVGAGGAAAAARPAAAQVERRARCTRRRPPAVHHRRRRRRGIVVTGTSDIVSFSLDAGRRAYEVAIPIVLAGSWCSSRCRRAGQRRVRVREREVDGRVARPARAGRTAWRSASAVKPAGSVRVTVPLCGASDQLCTSTGSVIVSPMPIDWTAAERPSRLAARRGVSSQVSNSRPLAPAVEAALDGRDDAHDVVRVAASPRRS